MTNILVVGGFQKQTMHHSTAFDDDNNYVYIKATMYLHAKWKFFVLKIEFKGLTRLCIYRFSDVYKYVIFKHIFD